MSRTSKTTATATRLLYTLFTTRTRSAPRYTSLLTHHHTRLFSSGAAATRLNDKAAAWEESMSKVRNIGISAHIDSGKTTLTERVLYYTGKIHEIHEVRGRDGVGAKMDSMDLEREKGITIQSAATYCTWKDFQVNIIDTPGHVDFTIEVERALRVLDGAILVLCSVGGVQSQSITVDRQMRRYEVPRLAFINKLDRMGADPWKVLNQARAKLRHHSAAVQVPIGLEEDFQGLVDLVKQKAYYFHGSNGENIVTAEVPTNMEKLVAEKRHELIEVVSEVDDQLAELFLADEPISSSDLEDAIRRVTVARTFVPVFMGSAFKNKGVQTLLDGVLDYLPCPTEVSNYALDQNNNEEKVLLSGSPTGPLVALAFKLEEGRFRQLTYLRIYEGIIEKGDFIHNINTSEKLRVPRLARMHSNEMEDIQEAHAGQIVAVFGVDCSSGDTFTDGTVKYTMTSMNVPEPVMSLAVSPVSKDSRGQVSATPELSSCIVDSNSDEKIALIPGIDSSFVELNTDKVIDALRNRRSYPRDAFSYFMEVRKHGFRHNVDTHLSIVRIFCSCGSDRLLESLLLEVIKSRDEELGFDVAELLDAIMERLEVEGTSSLVRVFDALVRAYVRLGMFDESIDLLFQTRRRGFMPCVFTCNYLIGCLIDHGKWDMTIAVYQQLKRLGLNPNVYTYNHIIRAFCRKGCLEEASDVFREMEDARVNPNEYSFTIFIHGLCFHGKSEIAYEVLKNWRTSSVPFDNFAYDVVVRGFCYEMKISAAEDVLLDMEKQGLTPSVVCYSSLVHAYCKSSNIVKAISLRSDMILKGLKINGLIVSAILQCLSSMGLFDEVVSDIQACKDRGIFLDEVCYNIWINALCKLGKVAEAAGVLEELKHRNMEMKNKGVEADLITYSILAGGFARNGFAKKAFSLLDYMKTRGLTPDVAMQNKIIEGLCVGGKIQEAKIFFNSLEEKHPDNYSAMIKGYVYAKHTREAFELFVKTFQLGIVLKKKTCMMLLNELFAQGEIETAFMLFQTFLTSEDDLCIIMYSKLIAALCDTGDLTKARWVFDNWIKRGMDPDAIMYTIMMSGYCRVNLILEAFELFHDMKNRGVTPDVISYTVLLGGYLKSSLQKSSSRNVSSRNEAAIVESTIRNDIVEMQVKPDVVCYPLLIDKKSNLDGVEGAVKLFEEMTKRGLQPDTMAYTALLSGFCRVGDVDGATSLVDAMTAQGVQPDEITLSVLEHGILKAMKMNSRD